MAWESVESVLLRVLEQQGVAVLAVAMAGFLLYERGLWPLKEGQSELWVPLSEVNAKTQALVEIPQQVLRRLVRRNIVKDEEIFDFLRPLLVESVGRVVAAEEQRPNPLSRQELQRLKGYQRKLQANEPLTADEARDLQALSEKVKAERPGDPSAWVLAFFADWLSKALVASQRET